jgi:hypothetical protein
MNTAKIDAATAALVLALSMSVKTTARANADHAGLAAPLEHEQMAKFYKAGGPRRRTGRRWSTTATNW